MTNYTIKDKGTWTWLTVNGQASELQVNLLKTHDFTLSAKRSNEQHQAYYAKELVDHAIIAQIMGNQSESPIPIEQPITKKQARAVLPELPVFVKRSTVDKFTDISLAQTAKMLKKILCQVWPGVKFSVTSDVYSIDVRYSDGPAHEAVSNIAYRFKGRGFDGQSDCSEHYYSRYQGKYYSFYNFVHVTRYYTRPFLEKVIEQYKIEYNRIGEIKINGTDNNAYISSSDEFHLRGWHGFVSNFSDSDCPNPFEQPIEQPKIDHAKVAESLRAKAEAMNSQIEHKDNPAIAQQNPTRRRARIAAGMREDAQKLKEIQARLYQLAEGHESGNLDPSLWGIKHKSQVEALHSLVKWGKATWEQAWQQELDTLAKAGIGQHNYEQAYQAFANLGTLPQIDHQANKISQIEAKLLGVKIEGYVPTPRPLAKNLVDLAQIEPGESVLEPSAGKGNIAEVIREFYPDNSLDVVERDNQLKEILELKNFKVVNWDIMQHTGQYDKIIMNPPFEHFQDIAHVKYCYDDLLKPGGRLVSIMSASTNFRDTKKAVDFREFVDMHGYRLELPEDSFKPSGTSVRTILVVLDKPMPVIEQPSKDEQNPILTAYMTNNGQFSMFELPQKPVKPSLQLSLL